MSRVNSRPVSLPDYPQEAGDGVASDRETRGLVEAHGMGRRFMRRLLESVGNPAVEIVLWDGQVLASPGKTPVSRLVIDSPRALMRLVGDPEVQFGELYSTGEVAVEGDLVTFLETVYRAEAERPTQGLLGKLVHEARRRRPNSLRRARSNIAHHYDISNDFYKLWLDERLVYTCAYYATREHSLEDAQIAKLDHVCRKMWLRPGESVVEAGCGWGALAIHMAKYYGVQVKAYNISREQLAYARDRARLEGVDNQVEFVEADYREIEGTFDAFVSVGMLEHVGLRHYRDLGATMDRCLSPKGRGLIHSIGRDRPGLMNRWIEKRIFPGANPPSLSEMAGLFEPWRFSILDVENLRLHYARTLEDWLNRYEQVSERVVDRFDESFDRTWRLYLAGSIAAFTSGSLQLFQVLFARSGGNAIPWTRAHLYDQE